MLATGLEDVAFNVFVDMTFILGSIATLQEQHAMRTSARSSRCAGNSPLAQNVPSGFWYLKNPFRHVIWSILTKEHTVTSW